MAYNLYPAVDDLYNFPPEVRGALAKSMELRNTVVPMTTTMRNNLFPAELWDGRVIANVTTDRIERYDAGTTQWVISSEAADIASAIAAHSAAVDPHPGLIPAGTLAMWVDAAPPPGWLLCDGAAVSRTTYAALFAKCGVKYGVGDTTTTFNLPNLANRLPLGPGTNAIGAMGGAANHSHQHIAPTGMQGSTPVVHTPTHAQLDWNGSTYGAMDVQTIQTTGLTVGGNASVERHVVTSTPQPNLPLFTTVNFIIKT